MTTFLDQSFQSLGWEQGTIMGGFGGECGGDCGGGQSYPAGVSPLPAPTLDPRPSKYYAYITPAGDDLYVEARPHRDATLLIIDLTMKQPASAGLPSDVPLYPQAHVQAASPGVVTYQISAGVDMVKQFYQDQLSFNGWTLDGEPIEVGGMFMSTWVKGDLTINISVTSDGSGGSLVSIVCEGCS